MSPDWLCSAMTLTSLPYLQGLHPVRHGLCNHITSAYCLAYTVVVP